MCGTHQIDNIFVLWADASFWAFMLLASLGRGHIHAGRRCASCSALCPCRLRPVRASTISQSSRALLSCAPRHQDPSCWTSQGDARRLESRDFLSGAPPRIFCLLIFHLRHTIHYSMDSLQREIVGGKRTGICSCDLYVVVSLVRLTSPTICSHELHDGSSCMLRYHLAANIPTPAAMETAVRRCIYGAFLA